VHYNTLIGLLGKARRHEQALDVYDRLCTEGTPDRISHFTVISALENGGDFAKAAEIKQKALGISDTAIPKKISKAGTLQQKLLEQEGGGLVNVLFAMSGEIQKCVQVLQESEDNGITPHVSHYLRVIALCGETGVFVLRATYLCYTCAVTMGDGGNGWW
jgi:pentatricopeptide repeat protein